MDLRQRSCAVVAPIRSWDHVYNVMPLAIVSKRSLREQCLFSKLLYVVVALQSASYTLSNAIPSTVTSFSLDREPAPNDTCLLLTPRISAMKSNKAALASPSRAGASICTPTASSPMSVIADNRLPGLAWMEMATEAELGRERTHLGIGEFSETATVAVVFEEAVLLGRVIANFLRNYALAKSQAQIVREDTNPN